jgi:cell division protein FtsI (penicillin-binding protein 3)
MTTKQNHKPSNKPNILLEGQQASLQKAVTSRLRFMLFIFLGAYAVMAIRLYDVTMLVDFKEPPIDTASPNTSISDSVLYGRADILDRNGVLLATTLPVYSLYADPQNIVDASITAQDIHRILPELSISQIEDRLTRKGRFVWLKRGITPAQHKELNDLGHHGLQFKREKRRFYPHGALSAHIIGAASTDGKGLAGIEFSMNDELSTRAAPLALSLDIRLQYVAHKALSKSIERFSAIGGAAMIANIKTGEILAAVSAPDFNPHHFGNAPASKSFNRLSKGVYEMGSTFKIFSTAAYLNKNGTSAADRFDATKPLRVGRFRIRDFHAQKREMSVADIFLHSSNIGTALMAKEVGKDDMIDTYRNLGFMTRYKDDAIRTASPLTPKTWREANLLTSSYGHGIAVSPIHLMRAFITSIGDGTKADLSITMAAPQKDMTERLFGENTVKIMQKLLRLGVTHGTSQFADLDGYQIGGKTGTAEKIGAGGYLDDKLMSSFIGAFPMSDPQYAILVMVDEPKGREDTYGYATGGWVAAPAAREIVADMASILSIPPLSDSEQADKDLLSSLMPHIKDKERKTAAQYLRRGEPDITPRFIDFKEQD